MLRLRNLNAYYGGIQALRDISLDVGRGEIVAVIGANAAGKSTMLACISRAMDSFTGEISFDGRRIDGLPPDRIVDLGLVQVPEGRLLFPRLSVRENLMLGAYSRRCRAGCAERIEEVFGILPKLRERASQLAGSLSGGEAQLCAIGRGLMAAPSLIMLDEPSLGLSPIAVKEVMALVAAIREKGVSVLLVEQNARQSLRLADRAYVIENGRVAMQGAGSELLEDAVVKKAYLGL
ncbi:MAG: ABC transporter ATP-binding protein [Clostridiales Family XIII bacterium]|jgi:branched-chain amino acid transport system ATP-binding protein|nr:ABC transporter ATP-binding protein [Clostridiales Family XIII bacterium]